jgi:hypothetical protein
MRNSLGVTNCRRERTLVNRLLMNFVVGASGTWSAIINVVAGATRPEWASNDSVKPATACATQVGNAVKMVQQAMVTQTGRRASLLTRCISSMRYPKRDICS